MENLLNFSAVICALMFGICISLLDKKHYRKPWNIISKVFMQISAVAAFLCTFFSLYEQRAAFHNAPLWALAIISLAPVLTFAGIANMVIALYQQIIKIVKRGSVIIDDDFLWTGLLFICVIVGSIAILYFSDSVPTLLYPTVMLFSGIIVFTCLISLLILGGAVFMLISYLLKNSGSFVKKYKKWLTN